MRFYSLDPTPFKPVTHDPDLKKQVLVPEGFSCVKHISHIALQPGEVHEITQVREVSPHATPLPRNGRNVIEWF